MERSGDARANGLLGFPPDARLLIVNCDDFGLYPAVNRAVVESVEDGIAGSCSLMPGCPGGPDAMRLLHGHPALPFGIHLTLVCETPRNPWGPVAARGTVPSLLDDRGALFAPTPAGRSALLARARIEEVETEFRAQIDTVDAAGLSPTHLDFHCLADGGRDDILDLTRHLAAEYGLAVRVWLDPARRELRRQGLPVVDHDFLDSFSLGLDGKAEQYTRLLHELPPGLSEWAVHPGSGSAEARAADPDWRVRQTDHAFLTSPLSHDLIRAEGVTVIDYTALRELWPGRPSPADPSLADPSPADPSPAVPPR
ncbi:polysaccharide deacetylase family protein [Kitasatospora sp. NBC_01539]|uniref:polysaccharide deacetylase family protein n=1 Tax=Kitasatospora sp. NBC_01539 TaxID=2903577 RepID=UPI0038601DA2